MKRLILIFIFILPLISCQKIFKEDKQNTFNLNTKDDYTIAMAGLYNRLFNSVMGNNLIYLASIANEDDLNVFPHNTNQEKFGGQCVFALNSTIFMEYGVCPNGSGSMGGCIGCGEDFTVVYKLLFQTVGNANNIISKSGDINKLKPEFRKIIGEVYFIRAYTFYRLARLYGQVPMVDNPDVDFTLKKPSFSQLYNFIAGDLLKAIDLLPKTNNDARIKYETPHRGSAKALLAEVYLTMGGIPVNDNSKYADAARVAKEVIDSSAYFGLGLIPDLADLWNGHNPQNMESEFGFHFLDSTKDLSKGIELLNSELFAFTGAGGLGTMYNNSTSRSYHDCIVAADFYNSFPRNYRKEVSFQTRHVPNNISIIWLDSHTTSEPFYDSIYLKHYDIINYVTDIAFKKFYTQFSIADSILLQGSYSNSIIYGHYGGGVVYFLRFAQTLLTYAEAMAHLGTVDASAYEAVNQVRRRANKVDLYSISQYDLTSGLSTEQFLDSVVQERAWELCAEPEGRWFDMVRLGLTKDLVKIKQKQGLIVYPIPSDRNTFFLPMPAEDTLLNPNLK